MADKKSDGAIGSVEFGDDGTIFRCVASAETPDSSGEILSVEGCDISDYVDGKAALNFEHKSGDSGTALDIVGRVITAKKIFKLSDCENEFQREYWQKLEIPYIYAECRLFDAAGHPGAIAIAAVLRDAAVHNEPCLIGVSVEGSTLSRKDNVLTETVVRGLAATCRPCNKAAQIDLISDSKKLAPAKDKDILADAAKAEILPSGLQRLTHHEFEYTNSIVALSKTITAGSYNAAPGSLTGGAALQREDDSLHRHHKNQARAALRDWDGRQDFRKFLKFKLPEADPSFLDRFADMVEDYRIAKRQLRPEDPQLFHPLGKSETQVLKLESLAVNLQIGLQELRKKMDEPELDSKPIEFQGKMVKPGKVFMLDRRGIPDDSKKYHIVGHDDKNFFIIPHGAKNWNHKEVRRLSRLGHDVGYHIDRWPEYLGSSKRVDAAAHGHPGLNSEPEQVQMIHGLDLGAKPINSWTVDYRPGANDSSSEWRRGPTGTVFLKKDDGATEFPKSKREVAFYNLGRDLFGLGHRMPKVAWFQHPTTSQGVAAVQRLGGAVHPEWSDPDFKQHMHDLHANGELDRMALMDYVLGNADRHENNIMFGLEGLKLIDHGDSFDPTPMMPAYLNDFQQRYGDSRVHPQAMAMVREISPEKLARQMKLNGVPPKQIREALHRLANVHQLHDIDPQFTTRSDLMNLFDDYDKVGDYL